MNASGKSFWVLPNKKICSSSVDFCTGGKLDLNVTLVVPFSPFMVRLMWSSYECALNGESERMLLFRRPHNRTRQIKERLRDAARYTEVHSLKVMHSKMALLFCGTFIFCLLGVGLLCQQTDVSFSVWVLVACIPLAESYNECSLQTCKHLSA